MLHHFQDEVDQYSLDWDGALPESDSDEMIELPLTECPLNLQETQELKQAMDPLRNSDCYGINIFYSNFNVCYFTSCNMIGKLHFLTGKQYRLSSVTEILVPRKPV